MLVFRFLCAGVLVWSVAWVLSRPEAAPMLRDVPQMGALGPITAAYIGGFTLAVRQGWGFIVALANGVWAGVLTIVGSGVLYMAVELARTIAAGEVSGIGGFFDRFGETLDLLLAQLGDAPLLMLTLAATACAGLLTEIVHWLMVRVRGRRQRPNS
jgi:hypothetical protein